MNTPLCDFVTEYRDRQTLRLHMPGHKGLGEYQWADITEIDGADVLYHETGVLRQSEQNAAALFGAGRTLYSTEGSSLCIRAMVYLARMYAAKKGKRCRILAARNAHKTFINAAALMDVDVKWLCPNKATLLSCPITPGALRSAINRCSPTAVYITSPDYLGHMADIAALAQVCRSKGVLLMVDNAHGAYLKFLPESRHPLDLGADICCDSAHKTLPVLTGGAYLHIASDPFLMEQAPQAMALFASTSPSYLILQSLDRVNPILKRTFPQQLEQLVYVLDVCRKNLAQWFITGDEPLKWTLQTKEMGYLGTELKDILSRSDVECEFADPDHLVMMFSPANTLEDLKELTSLLQSVEPRKAITQEPPALPQPIPRMSPHQALFSPSETLPVSRAQGRILSSACVTCPPAVPVVTLGEEITPKAIRCMQYYGIHECQAVL